MKGIVLGKTADWPINIPNILTMARILATPLFVILLIRNLFASALVVFTLAALSDGLDGFIARYFNQKTVMGAYLDPIADKFLLSASFITLAVLKILPAWLAVIVISRDILILSGIAVFSITGITVAIKPSLVSKTTTFAQLGTVFVMLLGFQIPLSTLLQQTIFWGTAGFTILSGLHYLLAGVALLQASLEQHHPGPPPGENNGD